MEQHKQRTIHAQRVIQMSKQYPLILF